MEPFQYILLTEQYESEKRKLAALLVRLKSDLQTYQEKNPKPTAGQKIHIEIRQNVIEQIEIFIEISQALIFGLQQQMYEVQQSADVLALRAQIKHLEQRSRQMAMVLTQGYGYNLSLLQYQKPNDFI